ncbi:MAG: copper chaperone PCu(A)C [Pseudomonadota bacterium]
MITKLIYAAAFAALPALSFAGSMDDDGAMSMGDNDETVMEMAMSGAAPMIHDAYARASTPNARSGAAFMTIMNPSESDDRLVEVRSDVAARVELHTHIAGDDGVMQMREVEGGFVIPAGGSHALKRGGDHVMFMGLKESFTQGKDIPLTFVFEKAGEVEMVITVDLERQDTGMHGGHGGHGAHDGHGHMDHGAATN